MKNTKKQVKTWMAKGLWAKALVLTVLLGVSAPTFAFAQEDAGAVAPADAGAVVAAVEPAPAPAAPVEAAVPAAEPAAIAPAPTATQTSLDKLSSEIMNILIPVFSALMLGLATLLLNWLRKKFKLDVSDKQIASWSTVAQMAADRGGEWARNKMKSLAENETLPGPDVMEVAANWAIDYGIAHGLPEMGRERLEGLIESKLHVKREAAAS
jgi:hypothetical protein